MCLESFDEGYALSCEFCARNTYATLIPARNKQVCGYRRKTKGEDKSRLQKVETYFSMLTRSLYQAKKSVDR